jgi:hypothetical protein
MELPEENLTFSLATGKRVTMKVWGNAQAAAAWLSALVSDRLIPSRPFMMEALLAVCEAHQIHTAVLFFAPTASDASYRLFETAKKPCPMASEPVALNPDRIEEEAIWQGGERACRRVGV